jgi:hypothetical protein
MQMFLFDGSPEEAVETVDRWDYKTSTHTLALTVGVRSGQASERLHTNSVRGPELDLDLDPVGLRKERKGMREGVGKTEGSRRTHTQRAARSTRHAQLAHPN